ncbi:FGGY carbohydrate kinase domain-containing protein isoform X7 [Prionailurus iriomotensis]
MPVVLSQEVKSVLVGAVILAIMQGDLTDPAGASARR